MMRIFDPPIGLPMMAAMPPMWNIGCAARVAGWRSGAGARPVISASRAPPKAMFQMLWRWPRLVPSAPFGFPVVPEV